MWCATGQPGGAIKVGGTAPAFQPEFVRRPALVGRLAGARSGALALIVAPPGYGKSSLLSEWAERDERPFVWLGHEAADPSGEVADSLANLLRAVRGRRRACVVVIDDAHLVAPELLREVTEAVLARLATGSMVALAARTDLDLPVGRLRAHRALLEIRMSDLAMSPPEAATLLANAGFGLDLGAVQTLVRQTEGWPVALYLAALSSSEFPRAPEGVAAFRGDDHLLSQYLRDEVLSALPAEVLTFMVRTAVLDELSGPLCDAALAERGSALTLAALARESQLLAPLDPAHSRYRWHPLFRSCLMGELRRAEPELEPALRLRASTWHADNGDTDRAIAHACGARDATLAGELLWTNIVTYLTHGRGALVRDWLSNFSRGRIADDAALALCAAHSCLASGGVEEAQQWAAAAVAACERNPPKRRSASSIAAGLAIVEAIVARDGVGGMRRAAERADELGAQDGQWRPLSRALRGIAEHLSGHGAAAARLLGEAADLGGDAVPSVTAMCLAQRAMLAIEQKDWEPAAELTDRASSLVAEQGLDNDPVAALVFAAAAASRAHGGRIDEAKRDLRCGLDRLDALGDFVPWYGAQARVLLAHASVWLADVLGARALLAAASRLARRTPGAVIFEQWFNDAWAYMDAHAEASLAGASSLTIAELRILRFLPSHRSFREIAAQLGVSANTVKTQAHAVYRKLGAASRSEAVARALDAGLLGQ